MRSCCFFRVPIILICFGCANPNFDEPSRLLDTCELLKAPHVVSAAVAPAKIGRKRQILHILNWHFVDRKAFEADGGENWEAFLASVESVQAQQIDLLQHLKTVHGVDTVFLEGLTDADMEGYRRLAGALARWKKPIGDNAMNEFLRQQHREDTLLLGAAAKVEGLKILPAEDRAAMEAANPIKDGKVQFDEEANERREDAIVRNLLASEKTIMVLVLGGDHDLENNIKDLTDKVEYVRVVVKTHEEIVGN